MEALMLKILEQLSLRLLAPPIPFVGSMTAQLSQAQEAQTMLLYKIFLLLFFAAVCSFWMVRRLRGLTERVTTLEKHLTNCDKVKPEEIEDLESMRLAMAKMRAVLTRVEKRKYLEYMIDDEIDVEDVPK